jgi:hypothetical protein
MIKLTQSVDWLVQACGHTPMTSPLVAAQRLQYEPSGGLMRLLSHVTSSTKLSASPRVGPSSYAC